MIKGSCHCGAVQWRFDRIPESVTACNCTMCRRRRIAVNVRLTEPEAVARLPIDHFDGLDKFEDLPRDGRCVADVWF